MITASIAIGVFGVGAGLGTVIAARSHPVEGNTMRLAAGTYHLDDSARAWKSRGPADGDQAVPLSGADEGSMITGKVSKDPRLCLTATVDGHAVGGSGGDCVSFAVLASAIAPLQRPGSPDDTAAAPPKKASSAPEPQRSTAAQPAPDSRAAPVRNVPDPGRTTAVQAPPAKPVPAPAPTKKVAGSISESGSQIQQPAKQAETQIALKVSNGKSTPKPAAPSDSDGPKTPSTTAQPKVPADTAEPVVTPPPTTAEPAQPPATPKSSHARRHRHHSSHTPWPARPSYRARPSQPTPEPSPDMQLPTPDPGTGQNPPQNAQLPTPEPGPGQNLPQASDRTVQPATPPLPNGEVAGDGNSLPIFRDPELLRRAQEALGLDRNMRYTDENGVWDLNIAPPGTPPCRDYSAAELQGLDSAAQSGGPAIPRDSCQWPAFIRWLYADPAPGQVSNWTKLTGLPERNLELVVTNPSTLPPVPSGTSQVEPDQGRQPDTGQTPLEPAGLPDPGQTHQGQAVHPDTRRINQGQAVQPYTGQTQQDWSVQHDTGQMQRGQAVQPYTGQTQRSWVIQPDTGQTTPGRAEYTGP
ncbi:hypothetical protein [Streptosporangium sp. NPDC087985]|uniref:hypothetical protein n=1 Tax=Streptosporangium sp. NPDC087985 TaxID=3366196 RepID=UPI0037FACAFB